VRRIQRQIRNRADSPVVLMALQFCDSPLAQVRQIFFEVFNAPPGHNENIPAAEKTALIQARIGQEVFPDRANIHETIFCFMTPVKELARLMRGSRQQFEKAARRAVHGRPGAKTTIEVTEKQGRLVLQMLYEKYACAFVEHIGEQLINQRVDEWMNLINV
jgi:hypothetical protein